MYWPVNLVGVRPHFFRFSRLRRESRSIRRAIPVSLRLLARRLILSFFARSDRPLSFVPAQVTGETTYTRRTARSRAPFAEDTQFHGREMLNRERLVSERRECLARPRRNRSRSKYRGAYPWSIRFAKLKTRLRAACKLTSRIRKPKGSAFLDFIFNFPNFCGKHEKTDFFKRYRK